MNRRKIFGWLAGLLGVGAASAQDTIKFSVAGGSGKCVVNGEPADCYPIGWQNGKAKNGQCPVCGTMAVPYVRATQRENDGYANVPGTQYVVQEVNGRDVPFGPKKKLICCDRCNAAFSVKSEN